MRTEGIWEEWLEFFLEGTETTARQAADAAVQILHLFEADGKKIQSLGRKTASALRVHEYMQGHPLIKIGPTAKALRLSVPTVTGALESLVFDGSPIAHGTDLIETPSGSIKNNQILMQGMIFYDVTQTLDGIVWKDVTFVNAYIKYRGDDLELDRVRFINCTFGVSADLRGEQFTDSVALGEENLRLGLIT